MIRCLFDGLSLSLVAALKCWRETVEFIWDLCWVTDMCGRDIRMFCSVKKHDGWGVSLRDLFLTSCCVKAPWLCNLPRGLKQCRLDFFFALELRFQPFPFSWFVCDELVFPSIFFWPCFSGLSVTSIRSHGPNLASPAVFCLLEQMAFLCDPFHTLEDEEGWGGWLAGRGAPAQSG